MQNFNTPFVSSAHHFVDHEGESILFNVISLEVIPSGRLDKRILDWFSSPKTLAGIQHVLDEFPGREVTERLSKLMDSKFLIPQGSEPKAAAVAEPSNYATFMVNDSQRCNLTCSYCYVNEGYFDYAKKPVARMKLKDAERLVQLIHGQFPDIFIYGFHFYGGEPLLNFKAIKAIVNAAELKAVETGTETDFHITTNGTLLNEEIAEFMGQHRFTVYYFIDSDRETHDEHPLSMNPESQTEYLKDIRKLVNHYIESIEKYEKPLDYHLTSKILQLLTRKRRKFYCPAGERMFGISAEGEMYPCSLHVGRPGSILGSINDGLDSDKVTNFHLKFSADGQIECSNCWNKNLCGGGCSAMIERFGHEKCDVLRSESESALLVYQYFANRDPIKLLTLVSPKIVQWANGELDDADALLPLEAAARMAREPGSNDLRMRIVK
jgi:radical SAM protein with 4Fe4S-binding SPASM domain